MVIRTSVHWNEDRNERANVIKSVGGMGTPFARFTLDKHHRDGKECHFLTNSGCVVVFNARTKKLVTAFLASPFKIIKSYNGLYNELNNTTFWYNEHPDFMAICEKNENSGYTSI